MAGHERSTDDQYYQEALSLVDARRYSDLNDYHQALYDEADKLELSDAQRASADRVRIGQEEEHIGDLMAQIRREFEQGGCDHLPPDDRLRELAVDRYREQQNTAADMERAYH